MVNLRSRSAAVFVLLATLAGWELACSISSNAVQAAPPLPEQTGAVLESVTALPTKTIETSQGGVRFAMDLPLTWQWNDKYAAAYKDQADVRALIGILRVTRLHLDVGKVRDADSPTAAARKRLAALPDEKTRNANMEKGWKVTIRDQRVIQVEGVDAMWHVTSSGYVDRLPQYLVTVCYLRWGGADFTIKGSYIDYRPERTENDLDQAQAEMLEIIQSFRRLKPVNDVQGTEEKTSP